MHKDTTCEDNSIQNNDNGNSNKVNEKINNKLMTFRNQEIIEEITLNSNLNSFENLNERNYIINDNTSISD